MQVLRMIIKKYWQVLTPQSPHADWLWTGVTTSINLLLVVGSAVVVCAQYHKPQWDLAIRPWADKATAHGRYIGRDCLRMVAVTLYGVKLGIGSQTVSGSQRGQLRYGGGWTLRIPSTCRPV
jgi:hypothetical protein